jgi:hypothetical protein
MPVAVQRQVRLAPALRDDAPALSALLQRTFRVPTTAMLVDRRHIEWKYWVEREDWIGPRSFTARRDDAIVAHAAAWPVRILLPDRVMRAAHLIDWASDPAYPGAGTWLLRHVRSKTDVLIATGGTEDARRTLPVLGFRPMGEIACFARPLRPFAQAWSAADKNWRLAGRYVRNSAWRWSAPIDGPEGWSASVVEPRDLDPSVWPAPSHGTAVAGRGAAFYNYLLASPLTRHTLWGVRRRGQLVGYFCLAYAKHVARIADLWVRTTDPSDWCAAVRMACGTVARSKDVHEITAWSSTEIGKTALMRAGFRLRDSLPLSVSGDTAPLRGRELHVQMVDADASFVAADQVCYLT